MTTTTAIGTLWVCESCVYAAELGQLTQDDDQPAPWALLGIGESVTAGLFASQHHTPCGSFDSADGDFLGGECECERREFSWNACHGCGSTLGGAREAYTLWI